MPSQRTSRAGIAMTVELKIGASMTLKTATTCILFMAPPFESDCARHVELESQGGLGKASTTKRRSPLRGSDVNPSVMAQQPGPATHLPLPSNSIVTPLRGTYAGMPFTSP